MAPEPAPTREKTPPATRRGWVSRARLLEPRGENGRAHKAEPRNPSPTWSIRRVPSQWLARARQGPTSWPTTASGHCSRHRPSGAWGTPGWVRGGERDEGATRGDGGRWCSCSRREAHAQITLAVAARGALHAGCASPDRSGRPTRTGFLAFSSTLPE